MTPKQKRVVEAIKKRQLSELASTIDQRLVPVIRQHFGANPPLDVQLLDMAVRKLLEYVKREG